MTKQQLSDTSKNDNFANMIETFEGLTENQEVLLACYTDSYNALKAKDPTIRKAITDFDEHITLMHVLNNSLPLTSQGWKLRQEAMERIIKLGHYACNLLRKAEATRPGTMSAVNHKMTGKEPHGGQ